MDQYVWAAYLSNKGYFKKLNVLYESLPSGTCAACTSCCSESVNMSHLEFLNLLHHYLSKAVLEKISKRVISYYLLELVKPMKCPFLDEEGRCEIYAYRPLPCRIFGNTTELAYRMNYKNIHLQNLTTAKALWVQEGLRMPKTVIHRQIGFCEAYRPEKRLSEDEIDDLYGKLLHLDATLSMVENISAENPNTHLVGWLIDALLEASGGALIHRELLSSLRTDVLKAVNHPL